MITDLCTTVKEVGLLVTSLTELFSAAAPCHHTVWGTLEKGNGGHDIGKWQGGAAPVVVG